MSQVVHVESELDYHSALQEANNKLVVVDLFAEWCPPCNTMAAIFDALSIQYPEVVFIKVNVDQVVSLKPFALPTFNFYRCNHKVGTIIGANEQLLRRGLENNGQVSLCSSVCMIQ